LQEWAAKNYPSVPIEKETAKFRNYEFPRPFTDWEARWKLWIQQAADYQERVNGSDKPSRTDGLEKLAAVLGIERRDDESQADFFIRVERINAVRVSNL
jgi:hypothetical protein